MPVITITRGSLSASYKLTERLSKELNCRAVSREEIIEHGKKYGIDEFLFAARRIMETRPPHSWDPHAVQIHYYLTMFKASLLDFVVQGDMIYHGLQTHFLLTDVPRVFKIKVVAPMEYRIKTFMEESGTDDHIAREHIAFVDEMRISWAKFCFGENYDDPTFYDMILNMSNLNLDAMVQVVVQVVRRPEFQLNAQTKRAIRDAHLKAVVRAYLVRSPSTRELELIVDADSKTGSVSIKRAAPAPGADWRDEIEKTLANLDLVKHLEIFPPK